MSKFHLLQTLEALFSSFSATVAFISSDSSLTATHFGATEDKPAPADFDGDGKTDLAVFRTSSGTRYLSRTSAGFTGFQFGASGNVPAQNAYDR